MAGLLPGFEAVNGKIVVLELAGRARMAADMAATLNESVGGTIGLTTLSAARVKIRA